MWHSVLVLTAHKPQGSLENNTPRISSSRAFSINSLGQANNSLGQANNFLGQANNSLGQAEPQGEQNTARHTPNHFIGRGRDRPVMQAFTVASPPITSTAHGGQHMQPWQRAHQRRWCAAMANISRPAGGAVLCHIHNQERSQIRPGT
jgi:hypothetical protein